MLAVALVEEGVRLREAGIEAPILVLSEAPMDSLHEVIDWGLTPTVYSTEAVEALADLGAHVGVHLKVDTGMHRVGAAPHLLPGILAAIDASRKLELGAVWSHFAVSDEDPDFTRRQLAIFDELIESTEAPAHVANTAGALLFPEARRDLCRIGLGLYGLHPCPATRAIVELAPAMRLVSEVTHLKRLPAGTRPSYGRIRPLPRESTVATVPVGYADGFWRAHSEGGVVLIGGVRHPLAGRVTMDQIVVDVGDSPIDVGDEVVLLGSQGDATITADDWAADLGTISYEVLCSIGPRVPRRYRE
jgi:alanine racemase